MLMIRGAYLTKYGTLVADLANQFVKGKDKYLKNMASAATMLELYESPFNQPVRAWPPRNPGASVGAAMSAEASAMTFMHATGGRATYEQRVAASIAGTDGVLHPGISCYGCHGYGHYSDECPKATTINATGTTLMQYGLMLAQATENGIDPNWILLDSQSTISVFCNPNMLANIRCSDCTLHALTNGGHQDSCMIETSQIMVPYGSTRTQLQKSCHLLRCTKCVVSPWIPTVNQTCMCTDLMGPL